ncbi:MAG TPA: extracellular solute-binding protein [Anaeromyxobacteraceae bacterium]|nr:extracellular solute-binding protein [Anaeromyxobacteraceae bacterium]
MHGRTKFSSVLAVALLLAAQGAHAQGKVTITVYGDQGQNLNPVEWLKPMAAEKGITLQVVGVPFTSVYEKLKTEFVGGTGAYDVAIFYPAYLGEFAEFGYIQPLDGLFSVHDPKMDDVVPAYRDLYDMYDGKTYALPYDGDILNLYYVRHIFDDAGEKAAFKAKFGQELAIPRTWDDLTKVAQFFTRKKGEKLAGKTLDQDYYGFAFLGARGFAYAWWGNIFGSLGGAYFDKDMKPQINSPAGLRALEIQKKLKEFCPPDVMNYGYTELMNAYLQGRVATMIQWSDVWKKANDPKLSKIVHDAGISQVPGVKQADGKIYFRASAPVGRVIAIPTTTKHPKEAFWVASMLSLDLSIRNVTSNETGEDPFRISHFNDVKAFEKFGTSAEAKNYLDVVKDNLNHIFPDVNIPGSAEYLDALDVAVTSGLSGAAEPAAALNTAAASWEKITQNLDPAKQKKIYSAMLQSWKKHGFWKD